MVTGMIFEIWTDGRKGADVHDDYDEKGGGGKF